MLPVQQLLEAEEDGEAGRRPREDRVRRCPSPDGRREHLQEHTAQQRSRGMRHEREEDAENALEHRRGTHDGDHPDEGGGAHGRSAADDPGESIHAPSARDMPELTPHNRYAVVCLIRIEVHPPPMSDSSLVAGLQSLPVVWQAMIAGTATWLLTALGAAGVMFVRQVQRLVLDGMLGFAAGVMVAASCWSLLIPALERGGAGPAVVGLAIGAAFLYALDRLLPHLHPQFEQTTGAEGPSVAWQRTALLVAAITLHNIPEGLAIGVAFASGETGAAAALAIGIGLQNLPEGLAVSLPLRREGFGRARAFWYGQASALVEPLGAALGAALVLQVGALLPHALAFAAGAMLYVVVEELIPETYRGGHIDVATLGFIAGFAVMMTLDHVLG